MIDMIQLGNVFRANVKRLINKHGWTQTEFADRLGVKQPYVSQLLSGVREPGLSTIEKVAEIFAISPDKLLRERD